MLPKPPNTTIKRISIEILKLNVTIPKVTVNYKINLDNNESSVIAFIKRHLDDLEAEIIINHIAYENNFNEIEMFLLSDLVMDYTMQTIRPVDAQKRIADFKERFWAKVSERKETIILRYTILIGINDKILKILDNSYPSKL